MNYDENPPLFELQLHIMIRVHINYCSGFSGIRAWKVQTARAPGNCNLFFDSWNHNGFVMRCHQKTSANPNPYHNLNYKIFDSVHINGWIYLVITGLFVHLQRMNLHSWITQWRRVFAQLVQDWHKFWNFEWGRGVVFLKSKNKSSNSL